MAVLDLQIGMFGQKLGDLGFDRLGQQGARTIAQDLGQLVSEDPWLNQLKDVIVGNGVSLLQWRSGGSHTPTIRRLIDLRRHQLSTIAPGQGGNGGANFQFPDDLLPLTLREGAGPTNRFPFRPGARQAGLSSFDEKVPLELRDSSDNLHGPFPRRACEIGAAKGKTMNANAERG